MKKVIHILISALLITGMMPVSAGALPEFRFGGIVDRVDFNAGEIVIDDIPYQLGRNLVIRDDKNKLSRRGKLGPGTKIGLTSLSEQDHTIHEIWVLPRKFDLSKVPGVLSDPSANDD